MSLSNVEKGALGERLAVKYLIKKGLEIVFQNYRCKFGEIDIIARDDMEIVFVEVKSRCSDICGRPCEAVNFKKQNKIRAVANYCILENKLGNFDIRFDVVEIYFNERKINHIENAF